MTLEYQKTPNTKILWLIGRNSHHHKCDGCGHIWWHDPDRFANAKLKEYAEGREKEAREGGPALSLMDVIAGLLLKSVAGPTAEELDADHACECCGREQSTVWYPQGTEYSSACQNAASDYIESKQLWEGIREREAIEARTSRR